jgi:predicted aldo/keto reductase-like oxidoreductase
MATKKEQETLIDALSFYGLRDLPDEDTKEHLWIRALGKVQKADGTISYVGMSRNDKLEEVISKDFGSISVIRKIIAVYPFEFLDSSYLPKFKTKSKEERIKHLKYEGVNANFDDMSLKDLDKLVYHQAMKTQLSQTKH